MKIAVVAGGWHWPMLFYRQMAAIGACWQGDADLFVVSHRHPELDVVREEKDGLLKAVDGPLAKLDRQMYYEQPTVKKLEHLGWTYMEAPNVAGDQVFLNQWLDVYDYRDWDVILNCHDDTFLRRSDLFDQLHGDWMVLANGAHPAGKKDYFRGSFEFWRKEMLDLLEGKVDVGNLGLTREGLTDSPAGKNVLTPWNKISKSVRRTIVKHDLKVASLSEYYRVSAWAIEGERGFLHSQADSPDWNLSKGLEAFPL